jgi:2-dehydro-3-deoxygluconokinase
MGKSKKIFLELKKKRLVALLSPQSVEECIKAYEIFQSEGILLEIALRSEYALKGIQGIMKKYPQALILAGTVLTKEQAKSAIDLGVSGIVSSDFIPEVIDICLDKQIMCIPGGLTDVGKQLAQKAKIYGCTLEELKEKYPYQWIYKLFPALVGSTSNLDMAKAWIGPYKDLTVMYSGGISLETIEECSLKDPQGIFCASALTTDLARPEVLKNTIIQWKTRLSPAPKILEKGRLPIINTVAFGELMLRLSPRPGNRLCDTRELKLNVGGAEANVAVSLANFGFNSCFVTLLPDNSLGDNAIKVLNSYGVDCKFILRRQGRMGLYFLEHGSGFRPSKVIYDRSNSVFSAITPSTIEWDKVMEKKNWFHWTGITPALGKSVLDTLKTSLKIARNKGVTVSADLNFRAKLWEKHTAGRVMAELMPYTDILIANEEDPGNVFGITAEGSDIKQGKLSIKGYEKVAVELMNRYKFKMVAITLRESTSASENKWSALLYDRKNFFQSPVYNIRVIDRVGTGDAFAAGLIYGILSGKTTQEALNFAVASSCLKHSIYGDFNPVTVSEVERLAKGDRSGRVLR